MSTPLSLHDVDGIEFQRKEWVFQRIGWAAIALFLLAAIIGVLSVGPLSGTQATSADGAVTVHYDRFQRHLGRTMLTVELSEAAVQNQKVTLVIDRDLAEGWRIENVTPAPSSESSSRESLIYEFDVLGESPPVVEIHYRGGLMGVRQGDIRAQGTDAAHLWQLTYP